MTILILIAGLAFQADGTVYVAKHECTSNSFVEG